MKYGVKKKWRIAETHPEREALLARELGINRIVARLLSNRNIGLVEEARSFIKGNIEQMLDPFTLKGMEESVACIERMMSEGKKIVIYGDYDVDGITATSLLIRFFRRFYPHVDYYIPERQSEGYGLNLDALEHLVKKGVDLVITVDCGISSYDLVEIVKDSLTIIITDHHTPPQQLPEAHALINPKQPECPYKDKNLSGVGVAFKLCQALWQRRTGQLYLEDIDIVALGTVADVVPLVGENRIFVREGLKKMNNNPVLGIKALIGVAGLEDKIITAGHIGYSLAPRLNAAGRVTHAKEGVSLLITEDSVLAGHIAESLQETNLERQAIEREILLEAEANVLQQGEEASKVLVVAGEEWHQGVIGIVASRLVESFYKPTLVISIHNGIGKGSCRSIENFDMYDALCSVKDLLIQFGGHKQAAGFSIDAQYIPELRKRLIAYCDENLQKEDYIPVVNIDAQLEESDVTLDMIRHISVLEPYGMANHTPLFSLENVYVQTFYLMGNDKQHIKYILSIDGCDIDAISWFGRDYLEYIYPNTYIRIAFTLQANEWQGQVSPQLVIQDMQPMKETKVHLSEEKLRQIYWYIKKMFRTQTRLKYQINSEVVRYCPTQYNPKEVLLALAIFKEIGILKEESSQSGEVYHWCQVTGKLDLLTSVTFLKYSS